MIPTDKELNCCFDRGTDRFNYRVGAIIIEDGCVLLATNEKADYYYSVGGRVHIGETARDAVLREVREELGVDYEIDRLAFVHENFFEEKNRHYHELALFFLMKPRGDKTLHSDSYCFDGKETFEWIPIANIKSVGKKVFPDFFAEKLSDIPNTVEMMITKKN